MDLTGPRSICVSGLIGADHSRRRACEAGTWLATESIEEYPMTATDGAPGDVHGTRRPPWLFWLLGLGGVIAVVGAAVKYSDAVAFAQIVHHARPWWLAIAGVLQLATYVVQGEVWRVMARRADTRISVVAAAELSLVHLFVDQALPSGGLSGAVMIAQALQHRGMTEAAAIATAVVESVSYYLAFLVALVAAVALAAVTGHASALIVVSAIAVAAFAIAVVATILTVAGGRPPAARLLGRVGVVRRALDVVRKADRRLVHDRRARVVTTLLQLGIILLDATTIIALVHAMGSDASLTGMFASYVIASVFRMLGILPGGLGSFEAASVITPHAIGVPTAVALSATLIFRGLSFWLPMLPGFVASRHLAGRDRRWRGGSPGSSRPRRPRSSAGSRRG